MLEKLLWNILMSSYADMFTSKKKLKSGKGAGCVVELILNCWMQFFPPHLWLTFNSKLWLQAASQQKAIQRSELMYDKSTTEANSPFSCCNRSAISSHLAVQTWPLCSYLSSPAHPEKGKKQTREALSTELINVQETMIRKRHDTEKVITVTYFVHCLAKKINKSPTGFN